MLELYLQEFNLFGLVSANRVGVLFNRTIIDPVKCIKLNKEIMVV